MEPVRKAVRQTVTGTVGDRGPSSRSGNRRSWSQPRGLLISGFALLCVVAGGPRTSATDPPGSPPPRSLEVLAEFMSGSFSSAAQAEADSSYFDIRLYMKPIWPDRSDGAWLYVEQAVAQAQDRPYRQRVYRLTEDPDGRYRSTVYELAAPLRFAGVWREADALRSLRPDSLQLREGCDIVLEPTAEGFAGRTGDGTCPSSLRGASYATSEVEIFEDRLVSWDRGFDADHEQVWGAEKGGYVFLKEATLRAGESSTSH